MIFKSSFFILILLIVIGSFYCHTDDRLNTKEKISLEEIRELSLKELKENIKFDKLPGKKGKLIAGFKFDTKIIKCLNNDSIKSLGFEIIPGVNWHGIVRQDVTLKTEEYGLLEMRILVSSIGCEHAQEYLLRSLMALSNAPLHKMLSVNDKDIGDFCLDRGISKSSIIFVRANVAITIRSSNRNKDITPVAVAIDNYLKKLQMYDTENFKEFIPKINLLNAEKQDVFPGEEIKLLLEASLGKKDETQKDPPQPLQVYVTNQKPFIMKKVEPIDKLITIKAPEKKGTYTYCIKCIDKERLLTTDKTIKINVVDKCSK